MSAQDDPGAPAADMPETTREPLAVPPPDPDPAARRYTKVAIVLHWLIALSIVAQLVLGWRLHAIPSGAARFGMFQLHKSIGLTILLLSLARLGWRVAHRPPAHLPLPHSQRAAADMVHWGLYGIMIGLPLTGWIMISTSKLPVPTMFWGVIRWPSLPGLGGLAAEGRASWNAYASGGHQLLAWLTVAMLALHVAAVLKHQLLDRDETFARMIPRAQGGAREVRFWGVLAAIAAAVAFGLVVSPRATRPAGVPHRSSGSEAGPVARPLPAPAKAQETIVPPVPLPIATATPGAAPGALGWTVTRGKLDFATSWSGVPVKGGFARWDADILFSPERLDQSRVTVRIDILSVTAEEPQQAEALPTSDWLDGERFPSARFRSTSIVSLGGNRYQARGQLTLRGVAGPLTLPFEVVISGDRASAKGSFPLDRTAFGVGQGEWLATDQIPARVTVGFSLQAKALSPRQ